MLHDDLEVGRAVNARGAESIAIQRGVGTEQIAEAEALALHAAAFIVGFPVGDGGAVALLDVECGLAFGRPLCGGVGGPRLPRGLWRLGAPAASSSWRSLRKVSAGRS